MTRTVNVELRGAPWILLQELLNYSGEPRVLEYMIAGPRGTGKTLGAGYILRTLAWRYPGIRMLYVRKTRRSITQAFCPDFENIVLAHEPEVRAGIKPENRSEYVWNRHGGSVLVLGGLDDPGKLYSTNWDVVVPDESAQIQEGALAEFRGVLRQFTGDMKFQLMLHLTNPRHKRHYLMRLVEKGVIKHLPSYLWDNPKWYDAQKKEWTPKGLAFVRSLQMLPGVLFRRNYLGEWCSAEGAVWSNLDDAKHYVDAPPDPKTIRWACAAMDWGHTDPCVLMVALVDDLGRVWIVREVYRAEMSIAWWTQEVVAAVRDHAIKALVVDPSRPEIIDHFNRELIRTFPHITKPLAHSADNTRATSPGGDIAGIDLVRHYLETDRLFFVKSRLRHWPCPIMGSKGRATCFDDEAPEYRYWSPDDDENASDARDRTDPDCDDHACDTVRYLLTFIHGHDLGPPKPKEEPKIDPDTLALMKAMGLAT